MVWWSCIVGQWLVTYNHSSTNEYNLFQETQKTHLNYCQLLLSSLKLFGHAPKDFQSFYLGLSLDTKDLVLHVVASLLTLRSQNNNVHKWSYMSTIDCYLAIKSIVLVKADIIISSEKWNILVLSNIHTLTKLDNGICIYIFIKMIELIGYQMLLFCFWLSNCILRLEWL